MAFCVFDGEPRRAGEHGQGSFWHQRNALKFQAVTHFIFGGLCAPIGNSIFPC